MTPLTCPPRGEPNGICGQVFERRFAEIPIVDDDAVVDRIAYAITNPVEANLVRSHQQWSGVCTFVGRTAWSQRFTIFHQGRHERALAAAERRNDASEVNREDFYETVVGHQDPPDFGHQVDRLSA